MLIGAIIAVPAFAAEDVILLTYDLRAEVPKAFSGDYVAKFYNGADELFWVTPVFAIEAQSEYEKCFEFSGAGPAGEDLSICSSFWLDDVVQFNLYINFSDNGDMVMDRYGYSKVELVPVVGGSESGSDAEASPLGSIFDVFGGVGSWIGNQLGSTTSLFWNASTGSLTFLGVLSICAVGFALILLLVQVVSRFLRFGG